MAKVKINVIGNNMTLVHLPRATVLYSYETPVAAYVSGRGYVRTADKFSKTTSRHISEWLKGALSTAETIPQSEIVELTEVYVDALRGW